MASLNYQSEHSKLKKQKNSGDTVFFISNNIGSLFKNATEIKKSLVLFQ